MKLPNPLTTLLQDATNQFYAEPVSLTDHLRDTATATLFIISTKPETFGVVKIFSTPEIRSAAMRNLLAWARGYVNFEQKHAPDTWYQDELPFSD